MSDLKPVFKAAALRLLSIRADQFRALTDETLASPTEESARALVALAVYLHNGVMVSFEAGIDGDYIADATGWGREVIMLLLGTDPTVLPTDAASYLPALPEA